MVNHRWVDVDGDEDVGSDSDDDGEDHLVRNASSETGENQGGKQEEETQFPHSVVSGNAKLPKEKQQVMD